MTRIKHYACMPGPERPRGVPDLDLLREAPEVYYERHRRAIEDGDFQTRVMASWGLIARGAASLPFLARMLRSPSADIREDAAGAYGWLARSEPAVVDELLLALESESDVQAQDSMICALGELKDKRALPALARMLRDEAIDGDTRSLVVESLGKIARRRFGKQSDPERSAMEWLAKHEP